MNAQTNSKSGNQNAKLGPTAPADQAARPRLSPCRRLAKRVQGAVWLAVLLVASVAQGAAPYPVCGTAVVDGNNAEWVAGDFFANMFTAGMANKPVLAKASLRYNAVTETMYVLVMQADASKPLLVQRAEAYVSVGTSSPSPKRASDETNNDGVPPDWAWIGLGYAGTRDGHNTARGFEASFKIAQGTYRINIHVNVWTKESETAAVEGRDIQLIINCRDFGDLPDLGPGVGTGDYQTLSANGGANHLIVPNLRLGAAIDAEADGQPGAAANGDDTQGATPDDEDGVSTLNLTDMLRGFSRQVNVSVFNNRGVNATLWGWIDFNANGLVEAGETQQAVVTSSASVRNVALTFQVPANAAASTYARFRLGTVAAEVTTPTGAASNGEVEDYAVTTQAAGQIGDRIFKDLDNDGEYDPGEGLAGVQVTVTGDVNGDGINEILTAVTDSQGYYLVGGLRTTPGGVEYTVTVATDDLPADLTLNTADPDGGGDSTAVVSLTASVPDRLDQDFGYRAPATYAIRGQVRDDDNEDGLLDDPNDRPIGGVTILLYSDPNGDGDISDGALIASAVTDAEGRYAFTNLLNGTYVVREIDPAAALSTGDAVDANDNCIAVALDGADSERNDFLDAVDPAGYFYDTADGRIVPGGMITVSGPGVATILQNGTNGQYSFIVDGPGSYTVSVTPPAGYIIDPARTPAGASFDPTGGPEPTVLGASASKTQPGYLDSPTAAANPFYYTFDLAPGDPLVLNNNYPLVVQDSNPLAAAIDIRALATAGGVSVEFRTIEEAGSNDIVLYVWLNGAWVEVGRAAAHGEGDHLYQFTIAGLDSTQLHDFKIEDDEGYTHYVSSLAADPFAATMVRMERDGIRYAFDSIPDRTYDIYRATSPAGPWGNPVKSVTAEDYTTVVLLPKASGAASAFFKTVLRGE